MIEPAKEGPLLSNHQKNPVKIVKRTNSATNSPRSAFLSAIMPNVQIMLIETRHQKSQVACFVMVVDQALATD